ncbi:UNVERIFIED_CONTAM: protein MEI2-like 2, partial [Sesamum radiatum]
SSSNGATGEKFHSRIIHLKKILTKELWWCSIWMLLYPMMSFARYLELMGKLRRYTSKMLLAAIDETHKGTYDFLYLPIDFKNKCNVGYAFINMVAPSHIITFYEAFNGKKWEKFNSEKVASLAYARIQGKTALISHFQNSSLMNEDKRCRPIVFQSEGQDNGDLDAFPTGNLNIFIRQPDGSYAGDSLDSPKGGDPEEK